MYGINKLYCERLGGYYQHHYRQLDAQDVQGALDFRGLRFPGLISAHTVPTGGTSDFAPEMLHAAAARTPYACFVREDTRIPFMAMPDGVRALLHLEAAPASALSRQVYNVGSFNPSAGEVRDRVREERAREEPSNVDVPTHNHLDSNPVKLTSHSATAISP